jgi:hypothetical protein
MESIDGGYAVGVLNSIKKLIADNQKVRYEPIDAVYIDEDTISLSELVVNNNTTHHSLS